jgi:hypothetical protein
MTPPIYSLRHRWMLFVIAGFFATATADGRVIRLVIETRGTAAPYERLAGRFFGELDPGDPHNAIINDIGLAPRNARGMVEYSATFTLYRPTHASKASGVLWYEVPNRGNSPLNPRPSADALAAGHILVSSGWQGDLSPRAGLETITVPVAKNQDGSAINGPVIARLSNLAAGSRTASLASGFSGLRYQLPASLDTTKALLTKQRSDEGQLIPVGSRDWAFANCDKTPFPGSPDPTSICSNGGRQTLSTDIHSQRPADPRSCRSGGGASASPPLAISSRFCGTQARTTMVRRTRSRA